MQNCLLNLHSEQAKHVISDAVNERSTAEEELLHENAALAEQLRQKSQQFEAVTKELELLAYSISHDLKAPLRSIRGLSEVLAERYSDRLDTSGRDFLRRICDSSVELNALMEELLRLSRIGRAEMSRRPVNLTAAAQVAIAELRKAEPNRGVDVEIGENLQATGDERMLTLAVNLLLQNAWKFTGKQPQPRIEFQATNEPEPAFLVRDNGAGFEMEYAGRLFGAFQRLHSASEFPGKGTGLATVQRIINRHGGRVWAQAAVNQGASFYFTLPAHAGD
jgi:light-regulated signal transduction histidine kinase (bacteriophytochrome)